MIQTIEAIVDERGAVRLLEPVQLDRCHRALVTILADEPSEAHETALLSEASLAEDWGRPEGGRRMGTPAAGSVVLVPFPFSDLSQSRHVRRWCWPMRSAATGFSARPRAGRMRMLAPWS